MRQVRRSYEHRISYVGNSCSVSVLREQRGSRRPRGHRVTDWRRHGTLCEFPGQDVLDHDSFFRDRVTWRRTPGYFRQRGVEPVSVTWERGSERQVFRSRHNLAPQRGAERQQEGASLGFGPD